VNLPLLFALLAGVALPALLAAQQAPLSRTFSTGAPQRYRVQLALRSELEGKRPVKIGAQTCVEDVRQWAEARLSWRASRRVLGVSPDGGAEITETLDEFSAVESATSESADDNLRALRQALGAALAPLRRGAELRYQESAAGQLSGLGREAAVPLGEDAPPVLTLWLMRAMRPAVALPARPIEFGARWQEPRAAQLEKWKDAQGWESGEWLEAGGAAEPAVRLHLAQQITASLAAGPELKEAGEAALFFSGDSISTLSLLDGRVLSSSRSGSRLTQWTIRNVPGLDGPQSFSARLLANVQMTECRDEACLAGSGSSRRRVDR
jgi:hypothetical protein